MKIYLARLYSEKAKLTLEETFEATGLEQAIKKAIALVAIGNSVVPERDFCVKAVTIYTHDSS